MSDEFTKFRRPTSQELRLITLLMSRAYGVRVQPNWHETLRVCPMNDGGMGSLRLATDAALESAGRQMGRTAAEIEFIDADGATVLASLNVDSKEALLELDMWKTDFTPLVRIPDDLPA